MTPEQKKRLEKLASDNREFLDDLTSGVIMGSTAINSELKAEAEKQKQIWCAVVEFICEADNQSGPS